MPLLTPGQEPGLLTLLLLALVQGVTEFLPVSSDGHLVLVQSALCAEGCGLALDVALHIGTLAAVLLVYRRDVARIPADLLQGNWKELGLLVLGSIPAAAVGLLLKDSIAALFHSPRAAALGLFATAAFLLAGEWARRARPARTERRLDWRDALWIGLAQGLAPLPGVSRSGTTIATALLRRVPAEQAARFSFLLSIPAVSGAVLLEVPALVREGGFGAELLWAVGLCFLVGVLALRFLIRFLGRGAFRWCALYCLALGAFTLCVLP